MIDHTIHYKHANRYKSPNVILKLDLLSNGTYRTPVSKSRFEPILYISSAGRNMRTHSFEISFAALTERRLHCAAMTPNTIVKRTENEAWIAPANGTINSEVSILVRVAV